jgi:Domain of unknown function (DUF892)
VGNLNQLPQVAAHHNWKNVDRSEPLRANQHQFKGASTYGRNEIVGGPFHQPAQGYVLCRVADPEGAAEDGEAGGLHGVAACLRAPSEGDGRTSAAPRAGVRPVDTKPAAKTCPAINAILEEGEEDIEEADDSDVLDAGMIADAQAVEHYEIASYGTLIAWTNQLGMKEAATLLNQTLEQEYNADRTLTELAESSLNRQAAA